MLIWWQYLSKQEFTQLKIRKHCKYVQRKHFFYIIILLCVIHCSYRLFVNSWNSNAFIVILVLNIILILCYVLHLLFISMKDLWNLKKLYSTVTIRLSMEICNLWLVCVFQEHSQPWKMPIIFTKTVCMHETPQELLVGLSWSMMV